MSSGVLLDTPFSRLKSSWNKVNPEALLVEGNWSGIWSPEGDKLEFSHKGDNLQTLSLEKYRQHISGLVQQLLASLAGLLPKGMALPQIPFQGLSDNPNEPISFLDSPQFQHSFLPLFQEFERRMLRSPAGLTNSNTSPTYELEIGDVNAWLEKEYQFQQLLLATLITTCGGVSPRQLTIVDCKIRKTEASNRNIFIMEQNLTWAWGKQKRIGQKYGSLWSYPPQVTTVTCYYLGVIRPFTIKILQKLGSDTLLLQTHLFAKSNSPDKTWDSESTNNSIQKHISSPLQLKIKLSDLRQIGQAIRNRHLQSVLRGPSFSITNQMANHSNWTSDKHYGRDNMNNISLHNQSRFDIADMLSASRAYHSWLGFIPAESGPGSMVMTPDVTTQVENSQIAFLCAQSLVLRLYNINCQEPAKAQEQAKDILEAKKFLCREEKVRITNS